MSRAPYFALVSAALLACSENKPPPAQSPATVVRVQAVPSSTVAAANDTRVEDTPAALQNVLQIGGLRPGMSMEELHSLLGDEDRVETFDEAETSWREQGYDLSAQIEFIVGFDKVLLFNDGGPTVEFPIWSVFVRNGRVMLLKFTRFVPGTKPVEGVGFPPSCYLTADAAGIAQSFGSDGLVVPSNERDKESHHLVERGLSIVVIDGEIAVLNLYEPFVGAEGDRVQGALRGKK